ncbi:sensor histidine kinase [Sulfurimonas sp.]|uniref:sensor histidine kinase n=1 Tax=Sulfurimonas sp. TaxID=2022749 RepID=UPI003D13AC63
MGFILFIEYEKDVHTLESNILNEMKLCSFDLKCKKYDIEFENKQKHLVYTLYKNDKELFSYYTIPNVEKYNLKIAYKNDLYLQDLKNLQIKRLQYFLFALIIIILLSVLFSFYTLSPLRRALSLTNEFIKDILHDLNTPISSLLINVKTLEKSEKNYKKIVRIEQSINTIVSLQKNFKTYIKNSSVEKEEFDLKEIVEYKVEYLQGLYPHINFIVEISPLKLYTNLAAIERIIENLLTNGAKYNKANGFVSVKYEDNKLIIQDSGKGIKNPEKIFDRFYKEHQRGLGIGLHIVKKLCQDLGVPITLKSKIDEGSTFILDIYSLTLR